MTPATHSIVTYVQEFEDHHIVVGHDRGRWEVVCAETYKERAAVWTMLSVYRYSHDQRVGNPVIGPARINLLNEGNRGQGLVGITEPLLRDFPEYPWIDIFQEVKMMVLEALDSPLDGGPLGDPLPDPRSAPFLSYPYISASGMSLLYGDGGVGKSAMALALGLEIASATPILSERVPVLPGKVIYLDYEDEASVHNERAHAIAAKHRLDYGALSWVHRFRLEDNLPKYVKALVRKVNEIGATLVILDSLGMAVGGDVNDADAVIRLGAALRALRVPILGIHHNNKEGRAYGSVYVRNQARLMWHAQPRPQEGDPTTYVFVENTKANHVARQDTQYLTIDYTNEEGLLAAMRLERTDVHHFPEDDQAPDATPMSSKDVIRFFLGINIPRAFTAYEVWTLAEWHKRPTEKTVINKINELVVEGVVKKSGDGATASYWIE